MWVHTCLLVELQDTKFIFLRRDEETILKLALFVAKTNGQLSFQTAKKISIIVKQNAEIRFRENSCSLTGGLNSSIVATRPYMATSATPW
jgi:hypothetical protein